MPRSRTLPPELERKINEVLKTRFGLSLQDASSLAEAVKKLSDFFIENPDGATPWAQSWAQVAYLVYFLPLNHARVQAVVGEALSQDFFAGLEQVVDFGAGPGTASLALREHFQSFTLVEKAKEICAPFDILAGTKTVWLDKVPEIERPQSTLGVFSYSLTELSTLPPWAQKLEALMILEPSTQQDGRKLLELRQKLIEAGFSLWAPCTHQGRCPLLTHSKTDWCHDRIHFARPPWFEKLEQHLPMKNKTLTTSYLLARKKKAPLKAPHIARTVGDRLEEKGKDRQLLCRGEEREFLAWMHKQGLRQDLPRGILVEVPSDAQKVSNELRIQSPVKEAST